MVCALILAFACTAYSEDYKKLIKGKWVIHERTSKMSDHSSSFVKAPWYVSYEFKRNGKVIITVKEETEDPHPYRVKGNLLIINKYGLKGSYEILELTEDTLTLKSPFYTSRFKRQK